MNARPEFNGGEPDYSKHPLVVAIQAEFDRGEVIKNAINKSVRRNVMILIMLSIVLGINVGVSLPGAFVAIMVLLGWR